MLRRDVINRDSPYFFLFMLLVLRHLSGKIGTVPIYDVVHREGQL